MTRRYLIFAALGLLVLAGWLFGRPQWQRARETRQISRELEWIQDAARALQQVPPPPADFLQGAVTGRWANADYLIFSNGWAAYAAHSAHCDDGMDDITLLHTSDGAFYLTKCHLCGGINTMLVPSYEEKARPADANDFVELRARRQEWTVFSAEGGLRCAVRSPQSDFRNKSKSLWVWIGSSDGTNQTTLLLQRHEVRGAYLSWSPRWVSGNELALEVWDYGPGRTPFMYENVPRRPITNFTFRRHAETGRFF